MPPRHRSLQQLGNAIWFGKSGYLPNKSRRLPKALPTIQPTLLAAEKSPADLRTRGKPIVSARPAQKHPRGFPPAKPTCLLKRVARKRNRVIPISARNSSAAPPPSPPPMPDARDDEHGCGCGKAGMPHCCPGYDYRLQRHCESATTATLYCYNSQTSELAPVLAHQLQAFLLAAFSTSTSDKSVGLAGMTR